MDAGGPEARRDCDTMGLMKVSGLKSRTSRERRPPRPRLYISLFVFVVFVALIVAGLLLEEFQVVLANATTICLSCIGIR